MSNKLFSGIMPAMITPFDLEGRLKTETAKAIMTSELNDGVQGFYINGATGEGLLLQEETRRAMAEAAIEVCKGRGVVINHVGAVDNREAIRLAKHAGEIGCDAVSSLVPNYINTYSQEQVLDYYKALHEASGLPVLVYCKGNVGGDPVSFMKAVMQVEGLIGCKYTMYNYYDMHRITEIAGGDINVINGPDEMLLLGLTMGADGGIGSTYNVMPKWFLQLYEAFRAGRFEEARQTQFRINKVIEVLLAHGCIPAVKAVFALKGFDAGYVAYPGKQIKGEELEALRQELIAAGYEI